MTSLTLLWLILLGGLIAIGPMSIDMYLPAFPAIEQGLGAAAGSVQFTLASFFIGLALGQLVYGPVSDRYGRRRPLMVGLALFAGASVGCALSTSVAALAAWRFLQALGGCAGMVIVRAVVRDRCNARDAARAFSRLILVMGLAPMLAPMLGGWVATTLGWRAVFGVLTLYGAACLVVVYKGLPETADMRHQPSLHPFRILGDYRRLLTSRAFLGYTLVGGLAFAGMFAYISGSPYVLIDLYGIPTAHFGWVFGLNALGFVVLSQLNARLLRRIQLTRLLHRALWVPALAGLTMALGAVLGWLPPALVLGGFFVYVASMGFIGPNSTSAALASHGQQAGMASALMGSIQFGLATLAGSLVGLWHDGSAMPLVMLMALCGVGALTMHRWVAAPLGVRELEHR